ncbi:hypothetical protein KC19_8G185900 [Ceratodon purpureus]|uniref:Serine aminopeptidase S33 domain-containing protein n=1 Tax=Ceratodon purpureus TaxID=3225 RepID=A0A8T0H8I4_CERPU|nr:hypothetical protein KC19_8G185900 [Ceratodon purpureus]
MLIEFVSSFAAPQSGAASYSSLMAFPRVVVLVLLLLVGALVLFYGKSLCTSNWKVAVSSTPAVAWVLAKFEKDPVHTLDKAAVEKLAKDHRLNMDSVAARRLSRDMFLATHSEFDFSVPPHKDKEMGLKVTETYVKNSRNLEIFVKSWVPLNGRPKGILFICHGYGDTVTFFNEGLARALAMAGYAVYGMDYPGFGLSEGLHGYIPNFDILVDDVIEQYRLIKERPENKGLSCFLFGESMGGAVALKAHLKEPSMWDGAVLVAPMCKIADAMYPPWYLVRIMITLAYVIPKVKLVPHTDIAELGFRNLEKRARANYNPVAYIGNPRLGTALQLLQTTDFVESKLEEVSLPLLVLHGAADQVTDPSISKLLYEKAKSEDKSLKLYDDAWHCLLQGEPDDMVKKVMMDIVSWLDDHVASKGDFDQQDETDMENRISEAAPNLIEFGKFDAVKELL